MHENREQNLIFDFNIDCNRTFWGEGKIILERILKIKCTDVDRFK